MSGTKAFFDTNILLYVHTGEAAKRARAQEIYRDYAVQDRLMLSTQVVQKFYAVGSRKSGIPGRFCSKRSPISWHCLSSL